MHSADIVRIARQRAGITQRQLADRSGHPRETIARWETGAQEPPLSTLRHVVEACGLDLVTSLTTADRSLAEGVADQVALEPQARLRRLVPAPDYREVSRALSWLAKARSESVLIGDIAAVLLGAAQRPTVPAAEFVAADPVAMETEMRRGGLEPRDTEGRWVDTDRRAEWTLPTHGTLILAVGVPGTGDFVDLNRSALDITVGKTILRVAHPRDLLRIAEASPRADVRSRAPGLRALLSGFDA